MTTKIPSFNQKSRLPYLRPPPNKPLKRRLSSDEASLSLVKKTLRSDANHLQGASNDCLNKLGHSTVTQVRVAKNPLQRSVSVVSLANHKKSEKTSLRDHRMKLIQTSKPKPTPLQSSTKENSGKMKRPAWDLKGRLLDTELILKQNRSKISDYENQMISLETEKNRLQENLIKIKNLSDKSQEKISILEKQLRNERNEKIQEKMRMDNKISELQKLNISLEAQLLGLKRELDNKCGEIQILQATVLELEKFKNEMRAKVMEGEMQRRLLHNEIQDLKGNIRVYCRVRPLIGEEIPKDGYSTEIPHIRITDEKSIQLVKNENHNGSMMGSLRNSTSHSFSFDQVFAASAHQSLVYEEISQLVQSVLDGYNVCVFAYGQTGSGKTYTMEGVYNDDALEGIIPRTIKHVFGAIEDLKEKGWKYDAEASFLEIYNETIRDLLTNPKEAQNFQYEIRLIDNKLSDICVPNLKVIAVENASQVYDLLEVAHKHRAVAATKMNHRSSRSHSVFQLKLKGANSQMGVVCEGTLNLVDLAGSERVKESGSEGMRLTEAQNINKSLANLGNVIMALSQKQKHIPYRNSKLTHLLQNSLGGNSKTLMFVNISPLDSSFNETLNSLRFATNVNQCQVGTALKQVKK